jgi:hypothetical protein
MAAMSPALGRCRAFSTWTVNSGQMIMVRHEAVAVDDQAVSVAGLAKGLEKSQAVTVVEDRLPPVPWPCALQTKPFGNKLAANRRNFLPLS